MNFFSKNAAPRILAGFGAAALLAGVGLLASRPAHSVGGPVAVSVANLPLPTMPTDVAAPSQPFQATTFYYIKNGGSSGGIDAPNGFSEITVPAGKRLIIQTVSVYAQNSINGESVQAFIEPTLNGGSSIYALPPLTYIDSQHPGVTQSITLSAAPGSTISFALVRNGTVGLTQFGVSVSGYLVNA